MSAPCRLIELAEVAGMLRSAERLVVTTHAKPDGDALGGVLALALALERMGKKAERWIMPPVGSGLKTFTQGVEIHYHGGPQEKLPEGEPDRIVILDTSAWSQLEPMRPWLEPRMERAVVVDHHPRPEPVAAAAHVDAKAPATCQIVADLLDLLGVPWDRTIAEAIYLGLASDTGWFRFSNTQPRTHELAARLLRCGVDHTRLYSAIEQSERPQKLALLARALSGLELTAGGKAAVLTLRAEDFKETGANPEETERFVDVPQMAGDVEVVVLVCQTGNGPIRLSFRSKPTPRPVDVQALARKFGGGGHDRAAGARTAGSLDEVRAAVIAALQESCAGK